MFHRYERQQKVYYVSYYLDDWLRISIKLHKHSPEWDEKAIRCSKHEAGTVEKRICLGEMVARNERIGIRVYILLGQCANQLLFKQRLDTERDELLVFQLKQDVV